MIKQSEGGRVRRVVCLVVALSALLLLVGAGTASAAAVEKDGYITMADGTQLEYTVELPAATGKFPVALTYAGYCEGAAWSCNAPNSAPALLAAGYAVLGVSIRGTSCSSGTFDAFTPQEWNDGKAAIEWAATQPWSDGHLGMFGDSFPGITQLGVAGLRPAHLDAVAPFQVTSDLYRDVGYPGGIVNTGFGAFWAGIDQPSNSYESGLEKAEANGDTTCVQSLLHDIAVEPTDNVALNALQHPYYDSFWEQHLPGANAAKIDVPVFGCFTWDDDEVGSRGASYLDKLDPARTWVVESNGPHGMCEGIYSSSGVYSTGNTPQVIKELVAFFNRFVKGQKNGFEKSTPHVQLWHETTENSAGDDAPRWTTTYKSYPSIPARPVSLYFRSDRTLALTRPKTAASPDQYAYPGPTGGAENGLVFGQHGLLWKGQEPAGASMSYTTPRLTRDTEFFGSGSANLWLSSTAPDTDLQITLTEVRPDGQEVYVSRGWLRASHRKLNQTQSSVLAPYYTDTKADAQSLTSGQPTYMRVQLFPFDYVFRKGSALRLWIDAPTGETGGWSFTFTPTPAVNRIYADPKHPSALVLGYIPGARSHASLPTCDTVLNQPCRQNEQPVPPGSMTITQNAGCASPTGALSGNRLGPFSLGMTKARARSLLGGASSRGGLRYWDYFCLSSGAIRVGYPSPELLSAQPKHQRAKLRGRAFAILTSNRHFALRGVRPGTRMAKVKRRLKAGRGYQVGQNTWYLCANGRSRGVLKVHRGVIEEIGIASPGLVYTRAKARKALRSFW
jgi:hypothetical protein